MVFGLFKNYPIFRYIIYDFLKKVSRGSRPTCLAKILCAVYHRLLLLRIMFSFLFPIHGDEELAEAGIFTMLIRCGCISVVHLR